MRLSGRVFLLAGALISLALISSTARAVEMVEQAAEGKIAWDNKALNILAAARDPITGDLWIGTEGSEAWSFNGKEWRHHSMKTGLPEYYIYALAVDLQGRVWAGHANHGVSVFDGKTWKNYDAMSGPLGSRVFAIKVCPAGSRMGEVWIGSDGGLARYSPQEDAWSYITRADGLPADQVNALAFDGDGRIIAGTQCDGLAIASPADNYEKWTAIAGPTKPTTAPAGAGLPSCMINDVLVMKEGTIYVATPWGMGKSTDGAKTFTYRRGADWLDKVKDRTGGPPADFKANEAGSVLAEDYVNCLAEDEVGLLWIGYRSFGYEAVDEANEVGKHAANPMAGGKSGGEVSCILTRPGAAPLIGSYGDGLMQSEKYFVLKDGKVEAPAAVGRMKHPSPAKAPGPKVMDKMRAALAAAQNSKPLTGAFLGDDWATQGDWVGRYGRQSYSFPWYGPGGWAQGYACNVKIGPHQSMDKGGPYTYYTDVNYETPRVLYIPNAGKRYQGEWNDGSFDAKAYRDTWEGPDLWVHLKVPAGVHRASLYFINFDGKSGNNRKRDFLIELKAHAEKVEDAEAAPALARARVSRFFSGVHKQFVLAGPAQYDVKIGRNYSYCTKLSAVFFDRLEGAAPAHEPSGVPLMGELQPKPPAIPANAVAANVALRAATELWSMLDKSWSKQEAVAWQKPVRMMALRLAAEQGGDPALLANWRFALPLMTEAEHVETVRLSVAAKEYMLEQNPHTAQTVFRDKMEAEWKRLKKPVEAGTAPDAGALTHGPAPADPAEIRAALAPYLLLRAGQEIQTRGLSTPNELPDGYFSDFKPIEKDTKAVYKLAGEYLLYSQSLSERKGEKARRQGLASAMAVNRAAIELLDDTWLAARVSEAFLLPQIGAATAEGPLARKAVIAAIIAAHTNDPDGLKEALNRPGMEAVKTEIENKK